MSSSSGSDVGEQETSVPEPVSYEHSSEDAHEEGDGNLCTEQYIQLEPSIYVRKVVAAAFTFSGSFETLLC